MAKIGGVILNIDHRIYRHWVTRITGFNETRTQVYMIYVCFLLGCYGVMASLTSHSIILVRHDIVYVIAAVHFLATINFEINVVTIRTLANKSLMEMFSMIRNGMFTYDDDFDDEYREIQNKITNEYKQKFRWFEKMYLLSYVMVIIVSPILGYFCIEEDSRFYKDNVVNPYLPHVFYVPFNTRNLKGFAMAYAVDFVMWALITSTTYSLVTVVAHGMVNLRHELEVLNYSLLNLEKRAKQMYTRRYGAQVQVLDHEELLNKKEFQDCVYSCLRANIQHHQILLKYKKLFNALVGPVIFTLYSVIVVVLYAALMYLILQPLPISFKLKYFSMLASEGPVSFFISLMGEEIIQESSKLFQSIYETPWFNYNRKFKTSLHIVMSNTKEPMQYMAILLNASASKQSFGDLARKTYSLLNLIRSNKTGL